VVVNDFVADGRLESGEGKGFLHCSMVDELLRAGLPHHNLERLGGLM
jgi:hypothetical protein